VFILTGLGFVGEFTIYPLSIYNLDSQHGVRTCVDYSFSIQCCFRAVSDLKLGFSALFWDSKQISRVLLFLSPVPSFFGSFLVFSADSTGVFCRFVPFSRTRHSSFLSFQTEYCSFLRAALVVGFADGVTVNLLFLIQSLSSSLG
jgi:hypothetical protein